MNRSPGPASGTSSAARAIAVPVPSKTSSRDRSGRKPDTWVSRCSIVIRSFPWLANSGTWVTTRSASLSRPSSTRIMTLVVVATALVSDARSKIVSSVIASGGPIHHTPAEHPLVDDLPGVPNDDHGPGEPTLPYRALDERLDTRQSHPVDLGGDRRCLDDQPQTQQHRCMHRRSAVSILLRHQLDYTFRAIIRGVSRQTLAGHRRLRMNRAIRPFACRYVLLAGLVACMATSAAAQEAQVRGIVRDEDGKGIAGATVTAESLTSNRSLADRTKQLGPLFVHRSDPRPVAVCRPGRRLHTRSGLREREVVRLDDRDAAHDGGRTCSTRQRRRRACSRD